MKGLVLVVGSIILLLISFHLPATAMPDGAKGSIIKGVIVDAGSQAPLVYANIVLRKKSDSSFVSSTYSGETGEFLLTGIPGGEYLLTISYVGYLKKNLSDVIITGDVKQVNLGQLPLSQSAVEVNEVTVEAERASEEFRLDKKVINISQSLHARGGSAMDALREQPSVRVDENDNLTLRGSSNFTVLVNGRPGAFQGSDALRQIPANMIESIELMTNPSAKYEAEGSAGIINIILRQEQKYSSSAILNIGAGTRDKYNTDATVTMNMGSSTITAGGDYRDATYHQVQDVDRVTFIPDGRIVNNTDLRRRDTREQYSLKLGIEHGFSEQHTLSLNGSGGQITLPRRFTFDVHNANPLQDLYQHIENSFDLDAVYYTANAAYVYKLVPGVRELTLEGSYTNVTLPYSQMTREFYTDAAFINLQPDPYSVRMESDVHRFEARLKLGYMHKFSDVSALECGLQSDASSRSYDVVNSIYDWTQQRWDVDPVLTNTFDMDNTVHAAYGTYSNSLFDMLFQFGLRAEYMDRLLEQKTMAEDYEYDKLDWFPSISVSRKFGEHQLQASYSRRVNRPNENLLNPFPFYSDRWLSSAGNPKLLPEYINSFELNYQKMFGGVFVSVQTYARTSLNGMWQSQIADSTGKMIQTFGNFAENGSVGTELSASLRPLSWLRLDPNVNLFHYSLSGDVFGQELEQSAFTWTARLNATGTFATGTRVQITGMYLSRQIDPQTETKPLFFLSVSARQDLFDRALSLTLQAQNLLTTAYYTIDAVGSNFANSFVIKPEVPVVNLSLSWNFNDFKRRERPNEGVDVNVGM